MTVTPSQLAYLPSDDNQAFLDWLGYHAQAHRQVAEKAVRDGHTDLGTYDVADAADMDDWLYFHNQEHQTTAEIYNLAAPPDLSFWDRQDPVNDANWLQSHSLVHQTEKNGLGL